VADPVEQQSTGGPAWPAPGAVQAPAPAGFGPSAMSVPGYVPPEREVLGEPSGRRSGFFGRGHTKEAEEAARLREWIAQTQGMDALHLAGALQQVRAEAAERRQQAEGEADRIRSEAEADARALRQDAREAVRLGSEEVRKAEADAERARTLVEKYRQEVIEAQARLAQLQAQVLVTDEAVMLQEVGIYSYQHPLQDAIAYRTRLDSLRAEIKKLARNGEAVLGATNWTVNGSLPQGRKMVRDFSKLMLRAYNAEADDSVRTMRPHQLSSLVDRLYKSRETIAKLGATMNIRISDQYHDARVRELQLTADYLQKKEEEKEFQRELRARARDEAAAQRELDRERDKLEKELSHHQAALQRLRELGDIAGTADIEGKLAEIERAMRDVEARAANIRTGYVYVISNVGAFGDHMVKIGMTRRLEPMDRIYELSGAAVPFRFDVHALIFSEDAVGLETRLHQRFADRRVNRVNTRREFFYVTPIEVREAIQEFAGQHLVEFTEEPQALEWRASRTVPTPS
jgi:hypothetical protein